MGKVMYCEKCGHVGGVLFGKRCKFCCTKMRILPEEMKKKYNIFNDSWSSLFSELSMLDTVEGENRRIDELLSRKNNFITNEVANNPLFSMEEYEKQKILLEYKKRRTNKIVYPSVLSVDQLIYKKFLSALRQ